MSEPGSNGTRTASLVVLTFGFFLLGMMVFDSQHVLLVIGFSLIPFLTLQGRLNPSVERGSLILTILFSVGGVFPLLGIPGMLLVWPVESLLKPSLPPNNAWSISAIVSIGWPLVILPWQHLQQRFLPDWSRGQSFAALLGVVVLWSHLIWGVCVWRANTSKPDFF